MKDIFLDFLFQFSLIFYFLYFFLFSIFFFWFVLFCYILKIFHSTIFQFHLFANFPSQYLSDCFCRQNFHKKTKSSVWENMQKDPRFHFVVFNYWLIALGKKKIYILRHPLFYAMHTRHHDKIQKVTANLKFRNDFLLLPFSRIILKPFFKAMFRWRSPMAKLIFSFAT